MTMVAQQRIVTEQLRREASVRRITVSQAVEDIKDVVNSSYFLFCTSVLRKFLKMSVIDAVRAYIQKMIDNAGPGLKALLMDKETTSIVSTVYSQSEVLAKEVFLFERIDSGGYRSSMPHLRCVVFLRPTKENLDALKEELREPKYSSGYYIYFTHFVKKEDIRDLAFADQHEVVRDVSEMYADFLAVSPHLFSLNVPSCLRGLEWRHEALLRCVQGLTAVLLSLKKNPVIRYQAHSPRAQRLAERVQDVINKEASLFDFRKSENQPVLLVIDRRDDTVTPLLNQWTYQAMVHELLGIRNNRVSLRGRDGIPKDLQEVVMSPLHDEIYASNLYNNFGEIGTAIKSMMEDFQAQSRSNQKLDTLSDMKAFVENYPQFKKMSGTVTKHVTVVGELSKIVSSHHLLQVSENEQELVSQGNHAQSLQKIRQLVNASKVRDIDALRLVLLYALRYETHSNNDIMGITGLLKNRGIGTDAGKIVASMLEYGGAKARGGDLFGTQDAVKITKRLFQGLKEVENIYTQHQPLLVETVRLLSRGRLKEMNYPFVTPSDATRIPSEVVLFIVGGATYEESAAIFQFNNNNPSGTRVILGGTTIHNSESFLEEVSSAVEGIHVRHARRLVH
ncbi:unnamed protein product [Notodromas monacha]|uniref:Vacuolar protein sorting-associated protein 45 n=1 Tax=Notodromas monacha TaxID=399045 RepID=A0A7R9GG00_9CRUS|nr:unnamed protein product [Notodromas monacha]CAG0919451.1 unnamed protein product [Notodromas monacha]